MNLSMLIVIYVNLLVLILNYVECVASRVESFISIDVFICLSVCFDGY